MIIGYNVLCFETMYKFLFCLFYKNFGFYLEGSDCEEIVGVTGDDGVCFTRIGD